MLGPVFALLFALGTFSIPMSDEVNTTIGDVLADECDFLQDATYADYCAYQFTDVSEENEGVVQTRAQFSIGCYNDTQLQEAEYRITIRLRDQEIVKADRIVSAHLPDGGAEQFTRRYCVGMTL